MIIYSSDYCSELRASRKLQVQNYHLKVINSAQSSYLEHKHCLGHDRLFCIRISLSDFLKLLFDDEEFESNF